MLQNEVVIPSIRVSVELEDLEKAVRDAFVREFGEDVVKEVRASKYPHMYSVVVWVTIKEEVSRMLDLCLSLQDKFELQGLPVGVSTREVRSNKQQHILDRNESSKKVLK